MSWDKLQYVPYLYQGNSSPRLWTNLQDFNQPTKVSILVFRPVLWKIPGKVIIIKYFDFPFDMNYLIQTEYSKKVLNYRIKRNGVLYKKRKTKNRSVLGWYGKFTPIIYLERMKYLKRIVILLYTFEIFFKIHTCIPL